MAKVPATKANDKFINIDTIMRDPALKTKLMAFVDEIVAVRAAIEDEKRNMKSLRDAAVEELRVNPKVLMGIVTAVHNNDYAPRRASLEEQINALEHMMGEIGFQSGDE